jgi:hypothetical protein
MRARARAARHSAQQFSESAMRLRRPDPPRRPAVAAWVEASINFVEATLVRLRLLSVTAAGLAHRVSLSNLGQFGQIRPAALLARSGVPASETAQSRSRAIAATPAHAPRRGARCASRLARRARQDSGRKRARRRG